MADERHEFNGRAFVPIGESTIGHDVWFMRQIREAGLDQITIQAGESPVAFSRRLLHETLASGKIFLLLGGLIVPEGTSGLAWEEGIALETADHLETVHEPREKAELQALVIEVLVGFFLDGLASLMISPTSSSQDEASLTVTGGSISTAHGGA